MGTPAARVGDMHVCPMVTGIIPHVGGPVLPPGGLLTLIMGMPAARVGDMCVCVGPPDVIAMGSFMQLAADWRHARRAFGVPDRARRRGHGHGRHGPAVRHPPTIEAAAYNGIASRSGMLNVSQIAIFSRNFSLSVRERDGTSKILADTEQFRLPLEVGLINGDARAAATSHS